MDIQIQHQRAVQTYGPIRGNRWVQLISAVLAMVMIANLQYAWTLFVPSLREAFGWSLPAVQLGFTLFIMFETFAMPIEGYLLDRFGPRLFFTVASFMVGIGWTGLGFIKSLPGLYFFYGLAGLGAGFIYGGSIAVAIRWFSDKRGLAAGVIAAGFGAGSAPFIPIISNILKSEGYAAAFTYTGILQGVVILLVAQILCYPPGAGGHNVKGDPAIPQQNPGFNPWQMLRTPHFWLIYVMFIAMTTGGLLVTAQAKPFAKDVGIPAAFVILAVTVDRISNGVGRIGWGWVSDKIGREKTMTIAFTLNAFFVALIPITASTYWMYPVLLFFIMLTWGEIFALFPSVTADRFGTTYAATNYGVVYSAKGFGGILGGVVASWLVEVSGWSIVFFASAALALSAAIGAYILKKLPNPVLPPATTFTSSPTSREA